MARKKQREVDPREYIMTPGEIATDVVAMLRATQDERWRVVTTGHKPLDKILTLYPGSLTGILGRPSHGKSMLCKHIAKRELNRIRESGATDECVVYVTLEEQPAMVSMGLDGWQVSVGDIMARKVDVEPLIQKGLYLAELPLFIVRHPGLVGDKLMPPLTPSRLYAAIEAIAQDYPMDGSARMRPTLVVLDYVQLLQGDDLAMTDMVKTTQVTSAIEGAKNMAVRLKVPVVMAVQAGRQTDHRNDEMPTMSDAQWASALEQACDVVLGVHRPVRRTEHAEAMRSNAVVKTVINDQQYDVNDQLMIIGVVKQRSGIGYGRYPVYLDPIKLELYETVRHAA